MNKTMEFNDLMKKVKRHDTQIGTIYLLTIPSEKIRKTFRDTSEVVPYMNRQGYKVMLNGKEEA